MEAAAHKTLTANATSSPRNLPKPPNVQLRSPDTSPNGELSKASSCAPGDGLENDELKISTTVKEARTDLDGSFVDRLLSPASERSPPGQLRSNRFSRNTTPEHALTLKSNFSEDITPTKIDYQSLPSPPELVPFWDVDHEFGWKVQCAYDVSTMRHSFRLHKYGKYALKYKRGFTPSPLRRAYTEQQEELIRLDALETTDSEPSSPDPIHRAYLARQEEYSRLVKLQTIDSEPSSPSPHPAGSNGEATDQVSESIEDSHMRSKAHITKKSSQEHPSQETQVSPPPLSLPAHSDVTVDDSYMAPRMTLSEFLANEAGSGKPIDDVNDGWMRQDMGQDYRDLGQQAGIKRRRDDSDDFSEQEDSSDVVGDSIKQRQVKRIKHASR